MSTAKYPNRDALRKAHDVYLDAMYLFVSKCLDRVQSTTAERLIRDVLRLELHSDIEEEIEISDIAYLVRTYWSDSFEGEFKVVDRYYDARSAVGLIVEGRNRASHPPWDLDPEFTRTHLSLIAEVLGKISKPDQQREVEAIRDELFGTAERLAEAEERLKVAESEKEACLKAAESEKHEYEKSKATLSRQIVDNALKIKNTSEQLKAAQTENAKYKKALAGAEKRVQAAETASDDYTKRLETKSKELDEAKADRSTSEERLAAVSDQLAAAQAEKSVSEERLTAIRELFTASTIGPSIFPPSGTDSTVRILDRRNTNKQNYLLNLLEQKQPTIIYVQSEEKINKLLTSVLPEKEGVIRKHAERTSDAEEMEILQKLENGQLIAVVSNTIFSTLALSHPFEHFVFCHLTPGLDKFFKQCEPAFTSGKNAYLHLIYDSEQDIRELVQKYPNETVLREFYKKLREFKRTNGDFINPETVYNKLDMEKPGINTGFAIFEELDLLERNNGGIKLLPPSGKKLEESKIHCRGKELKQGIAEVHAFQLEQPVEKIWEEILKKVDVNDERILRESNIHKMSSTVSEEEEDARPAIDTEQDKITPSALDVWPQRTLAAFNSLRQRASNNFAAENTTLNTVDKPISVDLCEFESPEFEDKLASPIFEDEKDYRNKYDLAMQFAQEHDVDALEQGIAQLIKDRDDLYYDFTADETSMLRAFQNALRDFRTQQSEQSAEAVESGNSVSDETASAAERVIGALELPAALGEVKVRKQREKKPSVAECYSAETTEEARNDLATKVAELRINASGSKPLSWRRIREKLGLKNDEFHSVIRVSAGYREAVINRIKSLKSSEEGWEYSGKIEVLTGIELTDSDLA